MKIDWNIAPDATHYDKRKGAVPAFMRKAADGSGWEFRQTNGGWMHYGELTDEQAAKLKKRPAPWTGEGLPPVGAVCELKHRVLLAGANDSKWFDKGDQVEVGGHAFFTGAEGSVCTVCVVGQNYTGTLIHESLRPIRTLEQIAAEDRDLAAKDLFLVVYPNGQWDKMDAIAREGFFQIYDAGYRKQVKP